MFRYFGKWLFEGLEALLEVGVCREEVLLDLVVGDEVAFGEEEESQSSTVQDWLERRRSKPNPVR